MARALARYASGLKIDEIAEEDYVARRMVDRTLEDAKKRLKARHLAQAIVLAQAFGYLTLPDELGIVHATSPHRERER